MPVLFEGFLEISAELIVEGYELVDFSRFTCQLLFVLTAGLPEFELEIIIGSLEFEKMSTELVSFLSCLLKIGLALFKQRGEFVDFVS